ncbi:DUF6232 family protein [Streptomyces sp. NPDC048288]|uniref:DUF6232 family protein n=1 Tax=Streptomyces sp. NPDC048288 TaxID=3365529 RepID=UPI003715CB89
MFYRHNTITIRVSRRVLWVGSAAYPLQNIARVMPETLRPSFAKIFKSVGRWFLVAYVVLVGYALYVTQGQTLAAGLIAPAVLGILAAFLVSGLIRLVWAISGDTLYRLNIETAGAASAVITHPDNELVSDISRSIMEAIDNPEAEFQFQVENFHVGDSITQFGNANTGKVTG